MRKRQGFALLWAVSAVSIVFLLGGIAFFMLRAALRSEQAMEIEADEAFLVQKVMETIKYNSRLQGALPVPSGRPGAERTAVPYFNRRKSSNDRGRGNAGGLLHCHR